jgi:dTDP-4-amino-4,6-dideoxygalactose transaminase
MISKEAKTKNKHTLKTYYASSARMAFSHILKHLFNNSDKKILMPAYIGETDEEGSGVFDPVRENKVSFEFYKLRKDLSVDPDDLKLKIISGNFKAVVIIHYFGFIRNNMQEIRALCDVNNVFLIEDCAHSFHSVSQGKPVGSWGELAFFSIHKLIATPDGGYFRINDETAGVPELKYEDKFLPSGTFEEYIRTDFGSINEIRRQNYLRYLENWKDINGVNPLYSDLPDGIIPLNFPIIVQDGYREKLYFMLVENGIVPISSYYNLIHEIEPDRFPLSYEISNSILNLPVHQDTEVGDVDYIIDQIRKSTKQIFQ